MKSYKNWHMLLQQRKELERCYGFKRKKKEQMPEPFCTRKIVSVAEIGAINKKRRKQYNNRQELSTWEHISRFLQIVTSDVKQRDRLRKVQIELKDKYDK